MTISHLIDLCCIPSDTVIATALTMVLVWMVHVSATRVERVWSALRSCAMMGVMERDDADYLASACVRLAGEATNAWRG